MKLLISRSASELKNQLFTYLHLCDPLVVPDGHRHKGEFLPWSPNLLILKTREFYRTLQWKQDHIHAPTLPPLPSLSIPMNPSCSFLPSSVDPSPSSSFSCSLDTFSYTLLHWSLSCSLRTVCCCCLLPFTLLPTSLLCWGRRLSTLLIFSPTLPLLKC